MLDSRDAVMPMARRRDADGGLVPKVYLYPTPLRARSGQSELDATSILKPYGFLVDAAAYGIQGVLAERLPTHLRAAGLPTATVGVDLMGKIFMFIVISSI